MISPGGTPKASSEASRLLILAPLEIEARALRVSTSDRGDTTQVVKIGMGSKKAAQAAKHLADRAGGAVAIAGLCGGLLPGVDRGDIIVASEVRGPNGAVIVLPSAPAVAQALRLAGLNVRVGPILSVKHAVFGSRRGRLGRSGAMGIDMESYWLLQGLTDVDQHGKDPVAASASFCVIRAVSDTIGAGLFGGMVPTGWLKACRSLRRCGAALEVWASAVGSRQVLLARPRSFCGGVKGAIRLTEEALAINGAPVYVLHEIVHNRHVVDHFKERGVVFVPDIAEVPAGELLVFSAHGVGQAERERAARRGLRVVDATCPLVAKVHAKAKSFAERGLHVVLIGKKGHDEVMGVMGEAPDSIQLVENLEDIEQLDLDGGRNIAVLTQTTLIPHQVEDLIAALEQRFPGRIVPPGLDVCYASQERQHAVRRVAPHCDLMLVLGSPNSSNSKRLVEEAAQVGTSARLVDDESEVDLAWLSGVQTLGLTAGASAPESLLERMIDFVGSLGECDVREDERSVC